MVITQQRLVMGEKPPWWYGPSHSMPYVNTVTYYPMPFNFFVRWARALWWGLQRRKPEKLEKAFHDGAAWQRKKMMETYERDVKLMVEQTLIAIMVKAKEEKEKNDGVS